MKPDENFEEKNESYMYMYVYLDNTAFYWLIKVNGL